MLIRSMVLESKDRKRDGRYCLEIKFVGEQFRVEIRKERWDLWSTQGENPWIFDEETVESFYSYLLAELVFELAAEMLAQSYWDKMVSGELVLSSHLKDCYSSQFIEKIVSLPKEKEIEEDFCTCDACLPVDFWADDIPVARTFTRKCQPC